MMRKFTKLYTLFALMLFISCASGPAEQAIAIGDPVSAEAIRDNSNAPAQSAPQVKASSQAANQKSRFPKYKSWVNDFANMLNDGEEKQLFDKIAAFEAATEAEIAVVTIESIEPYQDLGKYAKDMGNAWGVGKKGVDNGIMLVVDKSKRDVFIKPGLGLRGKLTDQKCDAILKQQIIPAFKNGNMAKGVNAGVDGIIAALK